MKYTNEIIINIPIRRVVELFDNTENLSKWQPGLISFEPISGTLGKEGAKSRLKYNMGKREVEMIETITKNNLPDEFDGTYEAKGVYNIQKNRFVAEDEKRTKWIADSEFQLKGMMKLIGFVMPGSFKKQSYKYMEQFKTFAESA